MTSLFASLRVRNYRLFATGQLISLIGTCMQFMAQDWLVLDLSHNSATALGVLKAMQFVPMLILGLYAGTLADRYDKRVLLIAANVIWGVLAVVLGALVLTGTARLWHVYVLAALLGTVNAIEVPVRQAFASEMVNTELLPNALSLNSAAFNGARVIGPAIAGLLIAWVGTGPVFLLNAVSYLAVLVGLVLMRPDRLRRPDKAAGAGNNSVADGLRYVARRPDLLLPIALVGVVGMMGYNFGLVLALLAKQEFRLGAASFGTLTAALAVGAVIGALVSSLRRSRPGVYTVIGAAAVFGVWETVVGAAPTFVTAVVLLVPTGFAFLVFQQAANQRVQLGTDPAYRGRVMALYILVFQGTTPLGAPLLGWLIQRHGPRSGLVVGGVVSLVAALVVWVVRVRLLRTTAATALPPPRLFPLKGVSRRRITRITGRTVGGITRPRLRGRGRPVQAAGRFRRVE